MHFQPEFMEMAFDEARKGSESGQGGPFGAVVVKNGEVIGRGHNTVLSSNDPTSHAEINAIRDACARLGSFQLEGCELYTTCEPCPMCLGAVYWARPEVVYFSASRVEAAGIGFDDAHIYEEVQKPWAERTIPMHHCPDVRIEQFMRSWISNPERKQY